MSAFRLVPTDQLAPETLNAAFGRAFADYVAGPFQLTPEQWPGFLTRQGVDLALGRAALQPDSSAVLAFALVAPRPALSRWRLATMGAVPEARGSGAAAALLQDFIDRGRAAGLAALELEVFAQNERALRLYRRHGFVEQHALQGWQRLARAGEPEAPAGVQGGARHGVEPAGRRHHLLAVGVPGRQRREASFQGRERLGWNGRSPDGHAACRSSRARVGGLGIAFPSRSAWPGALGVPSPLM